MNARTTSTSSTGQGRTARRRHGLGREAAVAAGLAALTLPLAVAVPAQAATSSSGCTVAPQIPVANGDVDATGTPMVDYVYTVTCDPGRSVQIVAQYVEQDTIEREGDSGDDQFGDSVRPRDFTNATVRKTKTVTVKRALPSLDGTGDLYAEVYQQVKFQVTTVPQQGAPVVSAWTAFELTLPQSIRQ